MTVDSHQHFWHPEKGDYPWLTGPLEPIRRPFGPEDLRPADQDRVLGDNATSVYGLAAG